MAVKKGGKAVDVADDETPVPLQAILLADSFAQKFRPITLERPKVLLPLINIPMIDYTLEWLASAGVEEVFVFCCAHAKQITDYLGNSSWQTQPNFKVVPIESHDCVSAGEALRLIDERNVVRGDFILVSGDTVSNMSLKEVLQEHKERRKSDKLAVMTIVVKRSHASPVTHQTRLGNDELLLVIDPLTKELLHYDDGLLNNPNKARQVAVDRSLYLNKPSICLCTDLQDCYIDICSPEVLLLFTDNFDYQHLRRDFVKGILSDEISGNKIFTYELHGEYASRIDNLRSYDSVSKDIIHRWTYPIVPDIRFAGNNVGLKIERCNVYRENGVMLPRSARIGPSSVLGQGTSVDENCVISNSVIGRNCVIGRNVTIEGSYLWDNVTIHDNVTIQSAVICDGCVVRAGARVEPGTVLSFHVVIGQNFSVPSYSKISLIAQPTEEDSSDEELEYVEATSVTTESPQKLLEGEQQLTDITGSSPQMERNPPTVAWKESEVGPSGAGFKWFMRDESQEEEWRYSVAPIPAEKIEEMRLREEQAGVDDFDQDAGAVAEEEEEELDSVKKKRDFEREAEETFRRLFLDGVPEANVILEVKALRLGFNVEGSDCAAACFKSIINLALEEPFTKDSELFIIAKRLFSKWKAILRNYLTTEDDQVEVLLKFEEICSEPAGKAFAPIFCPVLRVLYDQELIFEDAILSWASEKQDAEEGDKIFLRQCEAFIKWLEEASEEDDDDDDDDDA
ncbi:hypothetical protein KP509_17G061000 [Ceratopteris richardii]|uniref:Translation initiation factor eIF2B subunit epsilon n=1 Tax=Ceratopteris richardii TaxID=49495 RepID=A0A8T2SYS8_CERRI|nr:hypothetical protein KP509_17G061000 [Ceratopteris richardii]KAH7373535.1 hypothetical protein KP509_17G061000 [Ceratopteris richardii]